MGDVCLLSYRGSLTGRFKLVRVVEVPPDQSRIVRTVYINIRKPNSREKPAEIFKNRLLKEKVGVQRLIVIQPALHSDPEPDDSHTNLPSNHDPEQPQAVPDVPAVPHSPTQPVQPLPGLCVDQVGTVQPDMNPRRQFLGNRAFLKCLMCFLLLPCTPVTAVCLSTAVTL